jgi:hypothetical protein
MPDPRLISRAQRAATMLERAWDRWRDAHGLAAEPLPPVSSYVGYSIEEPWGRPRVVFGVDAADAEKLATLLQECAALPATALQQPPVPHQAAPQQAAPQQAVPQQAVPQQAAPQQAVPQQAMAGAGARIPAQGRTSELNETPGHRSDADVESADRPDDQADADRVPEDATTDLAAHRDDPTDPAGPDGSTADTTGSALDEDPDAPVSHADAAAGQVTAAAGQADAAASQADAPAGHADAAAGQADAAARQDDPATPDRTGDGRGDDQGQPSAQAAGQPAARYMPEARNADGPGDAGRSVTDSMVAELAGWASGELPGQASARLAAWAAVAGTTPRSGLDTELRTGSSAAESIL